jgi:hypothetical protein
MAYCATESADAANLPMCKEIGEAICHAYPGYSWHIRIDGGILIIKNMSISEVNAMVRYYSDIAHDAGARKRDVVRAAGELLEAASLRRGRSDGTVATKLEGVPKGEHFKPVSPPPRIIVAQ